MPLSFILRDLLRYGGITTRVGPELFLWKASWPVDRRIELASESDLVKHFGPGVFQLYVNKPKINGTDGKDFRINFFSVTVNYDENGQWSGPRIQTEEEDPPSHYGQDYRSEASERARRIAEKGGSAIQLLVKILEVEKWKKL